MFALKPYVAFLGVSRLPTLMLLFFLMAFVPTHVIASSLVLVSQEGDPIGDGSTFSSTAVEAAYFVPVDDGITRENEDFLVQARAEIDGETWFITFSAPDGQILVPGRYEEVAFANDVQAGLHIFRGNEGFCIRGAGRFEITEAKYRSHGYVERFSASFEFHCNGLREPGILGEVQISNPIPPPPTRVKLRFDERGSILENGMARISGSVTCSSSTSADISLVIRQRLADGQMTGGEMLSIHVPGCSPTESRLNVDIFGFGRPFRTGHARILAKARVVDPVYPNSVEYRKESVQLRTIGN